MPTNPGHLSRFKIFGDRYAVFDVTRSAVEGTEIFEVASGRSREDALFRLRARYKHRAGDRHMIDVAIAHGRMRVGRLLGPCIVSTMQPLPDGFRL